MIRLPALFAAALACAALPAGATRPRSLYAEPVPAAAPAASEPSEASPDAPAPSAAMEEKFRKLQKEMQAAPAASPGAGATAPAPREVSSGGVFLQVLFGLAFVLLLAVVSIRGLKRMQGRMLARPGTGGGMLQILETCYLGPQQKVIALRMHDEVGVLGVTKEGISLLTVLKRPADEIGAGRPGESNAAAFSDNLNKLLDRFKKPKKVSDLLDEAEA